MNQSEVPKSSPQMVATHNVGHLYNNPTGYINIVLPNRHCHKGSGEALVSQVTNTMTTYSLPRKQSQS